MIAPTPSAAPTTKNGNGFHPLWGDEGLTLLIAQTSIAALFLAPFDPTPGLYYALHKLLIGPDAGLLAMRSISLIAGTAAIAAIYATARLSRTTSVGTTVTSTSYQETIAAQSVLRQSRARA